jgi:hypothetical protein
MSSAIEAQAWDRRAAGHKPDARGANKLHGERAEYSH